MLLAAVTKVIGKPCPIWLVARANLLGRRQKLVTLEQPFEPNADVVSKELLEPALASRKGFCDSCNCLEAFIGFDSSNDLVYKFNIGVWLGMFRSHELDEFVDNSLIITC